MPSSQHKQPHPETAKDQLTDDPVNSFFGLSEADGEEESGKPSEESLDLSASASTDPPTDVSPDLLVDEENENSDATPTIISKNPPSGSGNHRFAQPLSGDLRGRTLAHFELIEAIGVGGMAAVIRARDKQLDRFVALKILPPDMASEDENVRRFRHEARAAAKLDHENIARVYYYGEDQSLNFIAFEFVEGDNLRTVIHRRGRLSVRDAIHYMLQVAAGLAHAASQGVVHRDIKPSNIIITPNGRAKLVDMGLARSQHTQNSQALTQSGVTLGTFDYISPEQALEPREADVRSDIYSLGCTFYHALTGQPPVPDGTAAKKLHHHQHVPPRDPRELNPTIPDSVAAVLGKMMAKNSKDRYQRPESLVQHLILLAQEFGGPQTLGGSSHTGNKSAHEGMLYVDTPFPNPPTNRPGVLVLLALVALVGLIGVLSFAPAPTSSDGATPHPIHQRVSVKPLPTFRSAPKQVVPDAPEERPQPPAVVTKVGNGEDLVASLKGKGGGLVNKEWRKEKFSITKPTTIRASSGPNGPVFSNGEYVIEGVGKTPQTLTIAVAPRDWKSDSLGLLIRNAKLHLKNLQVAFQVDLSGLPAPQYPDLAQTIRLAAFRIAGASTLTTEGCVFTQTKRGGKRVPQAFDFPKTDEPVIVTICVEADKLGAREESRTRTESTQRNPVVSVRESYFHKGDTAAVIQAPASISFRNCAFGPHSATFRLIDHASEQGGTKQDLLRFSHCTAFVQGGKFFHLGPNTGFQIGAEHSLFLGIGDQDTLCEQVQNGTNAWVWNGHYNAYSGIDRYLTLTNQDGEESQGSATTLKDFAKEVGAGEQSESGSVELTKEDGSPLTSGDELALLQLDVLKHQDVQKILGTFRINLGLKKLHPLWQSSPGKQGQRDQQIAPVGVIRSPFGPLYSQLELARFDFEKRPNRPTPSPAPVKVRKLVVDPLAQVHRSVHAVIPDATDGATIYIKHNGPLAFTAPAILQDDITLTIKPYEGTRPILTFDETKITDTKKALFEIRKGRIHFEGIEFRLDPNKKKEVAPGTKTNVASKIIRSVVTLSSPGSCRFEECLFTFVTPKEDEVKLRGVCLEPVDSLANTKAPEIEISNCMLRGSADAVSIPEPTSYKLKVQNSLLALDGSLVKAKVDPSGQDVRPEKSLVGKISIIKSLSYLTGDVISLRAKLTQKVLVTEVSKAQNCLFAAAALDQSLIHVEGVESKMRARQLCEWNGEENFLTGYLTDQGGMMGRGPESSWKMYGAANSFSTKEFLPLETIPNVQFSTLTPKLFTKALAAFNKRLADAAKRRGEDPAKTIPSLTKYGPSLSSLQRTLFGLRQDRSTTQKATPANEIEVPNFFGFQSE